MVELVKQNYYKNKQLYKLKEKELRQSLGKLVPIDHVGSTAIPNMYGKNIIDILVGANDEKEFNRLHPLIENLGYICSGKHNDGIYDFFASKSSETASGDIHIHLVILTTERYKEFLILRDYLLNNKKETLDYSNFKKKIIKDFTKERKEYKKIKSEYVTNLITRAKKWDSTVEKRDLYDQNKSLTGKTILKGEKIPKNKFILIVVIFIQNNKGQLLIQKRSENKGGKWAFTGGHPKTGETSLQGVITETYEEIGLKINNPILFKEIQGNSRIADLYYLKKEVNIVNLILQKKEVQDIKFATKKEIDEMFEKGEFKMTHYKMFQECINWLEK